MCAAIEIGKDIQHIYAFVICLNISISTLGVLVHGVGYPFLLMFKHLNILLPADHAGWRVLWLRV